ncbi:hypothetical protein B9Z55_003598 [Caenorhabditis nigoni]|uniref:Uncharacterized protein n=1 Tax=Caenorhabditis nigoni TaxID=1611254 RepID=A0A2G5VRN1_9PELO|nr:hypothetical protein B9Z55_003598 [Caenorhabditis nigoni]
MTLASRRTKIGDNEVDDIIFGGVFLGPPQCPTGKKKENEKASRGKKTSTQPRLRPLCAHGPKWAEPKGKFLAKNHATSRVIEFY